MARNGKRARHGRFVPPEQTPDLGGNAVDRPDARRKFGQLEVPELGASKERAAIVREGAASSLECRRARLDLRERVDPPLARLTGRRRPEDQRL